MNDGIKRHAANNGIARLAVALKVDVNIEISRVRATVEGRLRDILAENLPLAEHNAAEAEVYQSGYFAAMAALNSLRNACEFPHVTLNAHEKALRRP